jgi:hypothetical protein
VSTGPLGVGGPEHVKEAKTPEDLPKGSKTPTEEVKSEGGTEPSVFSHDNSMKRGLQGETGRKTIVSFLNIDAMDKVSQWASKLERNNDGRTKLDSVKEDIEESALNQIAEEVPLEVKMVGLEAPEPLPESTEGTVGDSDEEEHGGQTCTDRNEFWNEPDFNDVPDLSDGESNFGGSERSEDEDDKRSVKKISPTTPFRDWELKALELGCIPPESFLASPSEESEDEVDENPTIDLLETVPDRLKLLFDNGAVEQLLTAESGDEKSASDRSLSSGGLWGFKPWKETDKYEPLSISGRETPFSEDSRPPLTESETDVPGKGEEEVYDDESTKPVLITLGETQILQVPATGPDRIIVRRQCWLEYVKKLRYARRDKGSIQSLVINQWERFIEESQKRRDLQEEPVTWRGKTFVVQGPFLAEFKIDGIDAVHEIWITRGHEPCFRERMILVFGRE